VAGAMSGEEMPPMCAGEGEDFSDDDMGGAGALANGAPARPRA